MSQIAGDMLSLIDRKEQWAIDHVKYLATQLIAVGVRDERGGC